MTISVRVVHCAPSGKRISLKLINYRRLYIIFIDIITMITLKRQVVELVPLVLAIPDLSRFAIEAVKKRYTDGPFAKANTNKQGTVKHDCIHK